MSATQKQKFEFSHKVRRERGRANKRLYTNQFLSFMHEKRSRYDFKRAKCTAGSNPTQCNENMLAVKMVLLFLSFLSFIITLRINYIHLLSLSLSLSKTNKVSVFLFIKERIFVDREA